MREEWWDRPALRAREADLEEMGREASLDLLVPRVSPDYRDCLVWREPRETGDTREMLAKRVTADPEE